MSLSKPSLVNLSVEEESLASIPFAVLERRVGKKVDKLEVQGVKYQPDGTQTRVIWQVQGNNQLGLPTEQDLDIFVALGMLTFQNNFRKTVTFTGPELARILNIKGVHGKFYQRVKIAMDRFIPLRFRSLTITDRQEEVKWLNVFQEASFSLDRETGSLHYRFHKCPFCDNQQFAGFLRSTEMARLGFISLCESILKNLAPGWMLAQPDRSALGNPLLEVLLVRPL